MRNLQTLHLSHNTLEGGLPASIGTLRQLQQIDLAFNRLTDPLPDELVQVWNSYK